VYLSRRPGGLRAVFATKPGYLPSSATGAVVNEPYQESLQWSRRFSGLKVMLTLLTAGWTGLAAAIDSNFELGARLARELRRRGWRIVNRTPLPVVCFRDAKAVTDLAGYHTAIVEAVNRRGRCWISLALLGGVDPAIRACIGNYRTGDAEIDNLLDDLDAARRGLEGKES
jgi:glutamate/tyrosine decarboxylase-like PLP-dependent enzyme